MSNSKPNRIRLEYLDGLRGLAALYVAIFHVYQTSGSGARGDHSNIPHLLANCLRTISFGHIPVDIFIVLSGYCLMIPVATSGELKGGFGGYIFRRARRILPPYYAALAVSLVLIAAIPGLRTPSNTYWDMCLPAFTPKVIASHLLLVHNWNDTISKINYPMWSVATEWQLYFFLPILILPLLKRIGLVGTVTACCLLSLAPHFIFHHRFDPVCPQYLGLFAIGGVGAVLNFSQEHEDKAKGLPWHIIAPLSCGAVFLVMWVAHKKFSEFEFVTDYIVGLVTMSFLVNYTFLLKGRFSADDHKALSILETPFAVWLGRFSYSIYLIHAPVIAIVFLFVRNLGLSPVSSLGILLAAGTTLTILVSYGFHLLFERPFMTR